jgi:AcrR family transcriptional regulator
MGGVSAATTALDPQNPHESTRDRLLDAAIAVFREKGYDGTGVQEIARRAGLTTGAIYANFRGKADLLFSAIGARSGPEFDDLLRSNRVSISAGELLAELGSHLLDREDPADAQGGLLIEAIVASRRDRHVADLVRGLIDQRLDGLTALVERARKEGAVEDDVSTDSLTRFCLVLALGSLLYTSVGLEEPDEHDWSSLIRRFVTSLSLAGDPGALRPRDPHPKEDR